MRRAGKVEGSSKASAHDLRVNFEYRNVVEGLFLFFVVDEQLTTIRGDSWITTASLDAVSGDPVADFASPDASRSQRLVRLEGAIVHLTRHELSLDLRVAGVDAGACDAAISSVRKAMPEDEGHDDAVPIHFWWWNEHFAQEMARRIDCPSWERVRSHYSERTAASLDPIFAWKSVPSVGGRLVLWHGSPGTGKTTAIRALAREWRDWAELHFITDPERFLSNPGYLLTALSGSCESMDARLPGEFWRVLVLEDAGEFLAPDAKRAAGQGLSRLLNVCDGVLGQASRSLILVTANEPLQSLHPALSRPGRCLIETKFHELGRSEIERWCRRRDLVPPGVRSASLADLFAHADGRRTLRPSPGFGFAAA
jgi:hypothetical protein